MNKLIILTGLISSYKTIREMLPIFLNKLFYPGIGTLKKITLNHAY